MYPDMETARIRTTDIRLARDSCHVSVRMQMQAQMQMQMQMKSHRRVTGVKVAHFGCIGNVLMVRLVQNRMVSSLGRILG